MWCIRHYLTGTTKNLLDNFEAPIIIYTISLCQKNKHVKVFLQFCGKHSFNIFLFHSFLYAFYFSDFYYYSSNPLFIYILLLSTSLFVSWAIEKLKIIIGFYKIQNYIIGI